MRRRAERWSTPFGSWVSSFTPARIAWELSLRGDPIQLKAVYDWVEGRTRPRPERALTLVELASGEITLEQVFAHQQQVRGGRSWRRRWRSRGK